MAKSETSGGVKLSEVKEVSNSTQSDRTGGQASGYPSGLMAAPVAARGNVLDPKTTYINLAFVAAVVVAAIFVNNTLNVMNNRLAVIESAITHKASTQSLGTWAYKLAISNPDLVVSDPESGESIRKAR